MLGNKLALCSQKVIKIKLVCETSDRLAQIHLVCSLPPGGPQGIPQESCLFSANISLLWMALQTTRPQQSCQWLASLYCLSFPFII